MRSNLTINISVTCLIAVFFTSCGQNVDFAGKKILELRSSNVINESGCGDALLLIDEFQSKSFSPQTIWFPKERSVCADEKSSVVVRLDTVAQVQNVYIYAENSSKGILSHLDKEFVPQEIELSSGWNTIALAKKCQYIRVQVNGDAKLGEIAIEGVYVVAVPQKNKTPKRPSFNELMGTNAFVDDPLGALEVVQHVREYHESSWHQKDSLEFNFAPSIPGFEFELYYQNLMRQGMTVVPVMQHSAYWLTGDKNPEVKPMDKKNDTKDPWSYRLHAKLLYEFSKNYKDKGGALPYLENWNEPEKWWHGNDAYMSPYEYAALSSQDWDAHRDTTQWSIKKASPQTQMVMAGLSDLKSDYVNAMRYWCDQNRGGDIPWKVVNAHVYANDPKAKVALTPERFKLAEKVSDFVSNARVAMPQAQVWLSEFGYDRNGDSPQSVPVVDGYTPEEVQGIWLLRSFLLLSSTGLDKAYQYMIRDTRGKGLYTSSGLYKLGKEKIELAEAWYYLKALRSALGDYHFVKRLAMNDPDLYVFEFENSQHRKAYAAWAGVDTRKTYSQQSLSLKFQDSKNAQVLEFNRTATGQLKPLRSGSSAKIDISEKPILLLESYAPATARLKIPVTDLLLDGTSLTLFDEQTTHDPLMYTQTKPISLHEQKLTTVKFAKSLKLSYICLFDDQGQSEINIEVLEGDQWVSAYKGKLSLYQKWKGIYVGKTCKGLRITHQGATSKIGELVLYE